MTSAKGNVESVSRRGTMFSEFDSEREGCVRRAGARHELETLDRAIRDHREAGDASQLADRVSNVPSLGRQFAHRAWTSSRQAKYASITCGSHCVPASLR